MSSSAFEDETSASEDETSSTTLRSIAQWDWFETKLINVAIDAGVWENINPKDRQPWLKKPRDDASDSAWRRYERQQDGKRNVRRWMLAHCSKVVASYLEHLQTEFPDIWFDTLRERLDITDARLQNDLHEKYMEAMKDLDLSDPQDGVGEWMENWLVVMDRCRARHLPQATMPQLWWPEFTSHVVDLCPVWTQYFAFANREAIANGILCFEDVVNDIRQYGTLEL